MGFRLSAVEPVAGSSAFVIKGGRRVIAALVAVLAASPPFLVGTGRSVARQKSGVLEP